LFPPEQAARSGGKRLTLTTEIRRHGEERARGERGDEQFQGLRVHDEQARINQLLLEDTGSIGERYW